MPHDYRTNALNRAVGRLLLQAREAKGLTQDEVSTRTEGRLTRSVVANLENGRQRIALDQLYDLAIALDLSPSKLLPDLDELPAFGGTRARGIPNDPDGESFVSNLIRPRRRILDAPKDDIE